MAEHETSFDASSRDISSLVTLQSKDHEEILNVIDKLRSEGISKYVNLPQLIVCGDQSSGKSSVLEAISGLGFPRKDNLCTRFATELILRRAADSSVKVAIHPDDERDAADRQRIRDFVSPGLGLDRFASIVAAAEETMDVGKDGRSFCKDILRVEVSGPTQPHLTLVDLPGLYHASDEFQDDAGVELVEGLVLSYMQNERSVILAVVSAKSDLALQKVTNFTKKVDPKGDRTMGVITKPDTLSEGSDMEQSFVNLALNKRLPLRLGWHVLKNRKHEERHFSLDQRRDSEAEFLSNGVWTTLPRTQVGVDALRPRLSKILKDQILQQLPDLIAESHRAFDETQADLQRMGKPRKSLEEQRRYLLLISERFVTLMNNAINGFYLDPYFGDAMDDEGYARRFRAVVQNQLSKFSTALRDHGQQRKILDDEDVPEDRLLKQNEIRRSTFVEEVHERMHRSRGRELEGLYNPLIVGDLFYLQSKPWRLFAVQYADALLDDARRAICPILKDVADEKTADGLLQYVIEPSIDKIEEMLRSKIAELLDPQQVGHPITYNHYFIDIIQKARQQHFRKAISRKLEDFFADDSGLNGSVRRSFTFRMSDLVDALGSQTDVDMNHFACSEAIDCMQAYYKVARKKFVDDFSVLAVEKCLLEPLQSIFRPNDVEALDRDIVQKIASEDEASELERARLDQKLGILHESLRELHRLDRHNMVGVKRSEDLDGRVDVHRDTVDEEADGIAQMDSVEFEDNVSEGRSVASDHAHDSESFVVPPIDPWDLPISGKKKKKKHPGAYKWETANIN